MTACIGPYQDYIPDHHNSFRVPRGEVKIVFDGGGGRFNYVTKGKYPGYDPKLEYTFSYVLRGVQDHCTECRIQIHKGDTCDKPSIRYFNKDIEGAYNPWRIDYGSVYTSNRAGMADGSFGMFDGFGYEEHKRRTVVVWHGEERIACGILRVRDLGLCDFDLDYPGPPSGTGGSSKGSPSHAPETHEPTLAPHANGGGITYSPTTAREPTQRPVPPSPTPGSKGIENGGTSSSYDEPYTSTRRGKGHQRRHNGEPSQKGKKSRR